MSKKTLKTEKKGDTKKRGAFPPRETYVVGLQRETSTHCEKSMGQDASGAEGGDAIFPYYRELLQSSPAPWLVSSLLLPTFSFYVRD